LDGSKPFEIAYKSFNASNFVMIEIEACIKLKHYTNHANKLSINFNSFKVKLTV
jgi:hypothetical protein